MTITFDNLSIRRGTFALSADLVLENGSRTAVIGPSGGGKSTLLYALAGFVPADSGRILWDGKDITNAPPVDRPVTLLDEAPAEHAFFKIRVVGTLDAPDVVDHESKQPIKQDAQQDAEGPNQAALKPCSARPIGRG